MRSQSRSRGVPVHRHAPARPRGSAAGGQPPKNRGLLTITVDACQAPFIKVMTVLKNCGFAVWTRLGPWSPIVRISPVIARRAPSEGDKTARRSRNSWTRKCPFFSEKGGPLGIDRGHRRAKLLRPNFRRPSEHRRVCRQPPPSSLTVLRRRRLP